MTTAMPTETVGSLIEKLSALPADAVVVMSRDGEGNGFSPFCGDADLGWYEPATTWHGEFLGVLDADDDPDEYPARPDGPPNAICLWPVN